jgi:hypothetical protein
MTPIRQATGDDLPDKTFPNLFAILQNAWTRYPNRLAVASNRYLLEFANGPLPTSFPAAKPFVNSSGRAGGPGKPIN